MNDKLNGRIVFLPRGRDQREDLNILADAIAASDADLFEGIWITAGKCISITPDVLRKICTKYVVTKHARETADGWKVEYWPYEPDEMTLRALLMAKTREDGSLIARLPKAPSEPVKLSEQQQRQVRDRLGIG